MLKKLTYFLIFAVISTPSLAKRDKNILLKLGNKEQIGEEIAIEFDNRDLGFKTQSAKMEMVLKNAYGQENRRQMESRTFERPQRDIGDKSLLIFFSPKDINGTALLSHANILDPDNQWLYLPSLKRVKRISSKNKSGPFVGSEFAYEDITGNEIGKYSWQFDKIETCPNNKKWQCYKLISKPKYKHSGYTKRLVWADIEELRLDQIEFYDRKGAKFKTQTNRNYKQYLGEYWRADNWYMVNHQNNKKTELIFKDYQFNKGLKERDFTKAALKRIR
jgi:outer membrane lipoprotein-sorting protein